MKTAALTILAAAGFALASCGSSQPAGQGATADTVELPAEEAMAGTSAMPSDMQTEMATIVATDEGMDTAAAAGASGAAMPAASEGANVTPDR